MATASLSSLITAYIPSIDQPLTDYLVAVLTGSSYDSPEDVQEAIGDVLDSCVQDRLAKEDAEAAEIEIICQKLYEVLKAETAEGGDENGVGDGEEKLEKPIYLGTMSTGFVVKDEASSSLWTCIHTPASKVDPKKLARAELRLKHKAEKRELQPFSEYQPPAKHIEATASQAVSKKTLERTRDIKIENFDLAFGSRLLLENAELNLSYGIRYGMYGRNGIGKSTLLKMLSNGSLVIPSHISILHVEQEVVGDDTTVLNSVLECDTARMELLCEESTLAEKGNLTEEESARLNEVYVQLMAIEADKAPARASIILAGLGFTPEMQQRATKTYSGGWRMRIALARALFSRPDLLLLDEPTNMLDMKTIIWLTNYLVEHWHSTLLIVSHDRKFLSEVPNCIVHFHSKKLETYRGNFASFMAAMTEKLKNQQREYEAQQLYRKHAQTFIDKFRADNKQAAMVQSRIRQLEKMDKVEAVKVDPPVVLKFPTPESLSPPILQLVGVSFRYNAERLILKDINLNANLQSRICIVGDNGSGKTTLLKLLTGDLQPSSGIRNIHRNLAIGYFTQHHVDQLTMNMCPLQFMATKDPGKSEEHYRRYLAGFGVTGELSLQSLQTLSGGQKSRVAFAAMTLSNPHMLILDEPSNHLDMDTVEALAKSLNEYTGGVILVTHDQTLIESVCQELWYCSGGTVTCLKGGFEEYLKIVQKELKELEGS